jgi:hypothetical protein
MAVVTTIPAREDIEGRLELKFGLETRNLKPGFHIVVMVVKIESRSFSTASL